MRRYSKSLCGQYVLRIIRVLICFALHLHNYFALVSVSFLALSIVSFTIGDRTPGDNGYILSFSFKNENIEHLVRAQLLLKEFEKYSTLDIASMKCRIYSSQQHCDRSLSASACDSYLSSIQETCVQVFDSYLRDSFLSVIRKSRVEFDDWMLHLSTSFTIEEVDHFRTQTDDPVVAFIESLVSPRNGDASSNLKAISTERPVRILEIGSHNGGSAMWWARNMLAHPDSFLICVDAWEKVDLDNGTITVPDTAMMEAFLRSLQTVPNGEKVFMIKSDSLSGAAGLLHYFVKGSSVEEVFDIVYIDGSHTMAEVISDALLSIPMLKKGGWLFFDDYNCNPWSLPHQRVKEAVDAVVEVYGDELIIEQLGTQHQVAVLKKRGEISSAPNPNRLLSIVQSYHKNFQSDFPIYPLNVLDIGSYASGFAEIILSHSFNLGEIIVIADLDRVVLDENRDLLSQPMSQKLQQLYIDSLTENYSEKLVVKDGPILHELTNLIIGTDNFDSKFNIVFFDGGGDLKSILAVLTLSFRLLAHHGIMVIDRWSIGDKSRVKATIDVFLSAFINEIHVIETSSASFRYIVMLKTQNRFIWNYADLGMKMSELLDVPCCTRLK